MKNKGVLFRQILIGSILTIALTLSIFTIIYLNNYITDSAKFREKLITRSFEGSLSEHLGFLSVLTTEISDHPDIRKKVKDRTKNKKIEEYLLILKRELDSIPAPAQPAVIDEDSNIEIEAMRGQEYLQSWLNPETISKINYKNLNLDPKKIEQDSTAGRTSTSSRLYLLTATPDKKKNVTLNSFLLIPTQLVPIEKGEIKLTETVKKEIIYSKVIEQDLVNILNDLKNENIWQVYFIPISGLVRILNPNRDELVDYYKNFISGLVSFSDRPYFKMTMKDDSRVRISNPYIDSAGNGLIVTHSIFIRNTNLGIMGMVGVDRKIEQLGDILDDVKLGEASGPKAFKLHTHFLYNTNCNKCHQEKYKFIDDQNRKSYTEAEAFPWATAQIAGRRDNFKNDLIARFKVPGGESVIYAVNLGKEIDSYGNSVHKVAYFHFNPRYTRAKDRYLLLYYVFSLLGIAIPVVMAVNFFLSRAKTQKIHTEVVSNLNGGLIIVDNTGNIKFHNRGMENLIESSDLMNKNFLTDLLTFESKAEYEELLQNTSRGFEFSGRITREDGTVFPAIISNAAINYPGVPNAQMAIIIPSELLESTIAGEFIHSFSHALKTPIQSILLLADRLRRKKIPQQQFDHYYSLMKREVDEFTNMVTNLLRFSRLELEEIRPSKTSQNIAALLRSAVKPFKEKAKKKQLSLNESIPERIIAETDRDMFRVILNNLLENALKYTEEGEITVSISETPEELLISVADTGIGIPPDERDKIFEKFYRGRAQEVQVKDGIGIGLYISQKYVSLLGGTLVYEPNIIEKMKKDKAGNLSKVSIEKGSKFTLHFDNV